MVFRASSFRMVPGSRKSSENTADLSCMARSSRSCTCGGRKASASEVLGSLGSG
jgi:hypothetical protein